jgi:hypothetical protein
MRKPMTAMSRDDGDDGDSKVTAIPRWRRFLRRFKLNT